MNVKTFFNIQTGIGVVKIILYIPKFNIQVTDPLFFALFSYIVYAVIFYDA